MTHMHSQLKQYVQFIEFQCRLNIDVINSGNVRIVDPDIIRKSNEKLLDVADYKTPNGGIDNEFVAHIFYPL